MKHVPVHFWTTITSARFEKYLAERMTLNGKPMPPETMRDIVRHIFNGIADVLIQEGEVHIREFGIFRLYTVEKSKKDTYRVQVYLEEAVQKAIEEKRRIMPLTDNIVEECLTENQKWMRDNYYKVKAEIAAREAREAEEKKKKAAQKKADTTS